LIGARSGILGVLAGSKSGPPEGGRYKFKGRGNFKSRGKFKDKGKFEGEFDGKFGDKCKGEELPGAPSLGRACDHCGGLFCIAFVAATFRWAPLT
jgi:hypothetical protein